MSVIKKAFIIYDGITNSVFESQVIGPLTKALENNPALHITLVSFERFLRAARLNEQSLRLHQRLKVLLVPRSRYCGNISLLAPILYLRYFLKNYTPDQIVARGPFAGYIASKARKGTVPLTIQVRGLCGEEYRFKHQNAPQSALNKVLGNILYRLFSNLEKKVFSLQEEHLTFEVVSAALEKYLKEHFRVSEKKITRAINDIPPVYDAALVASWRVAIREQLHIPADCFVYCYSGSMQPWQCIDEMIDFVKKEHECKGNIFFLVLTNEPRAFKERLDNSGIDPLGYAVYNVPYEKHYQYLAAAQAGLLFRKSDIINWVSRPTKMLEYRAVGLTIIHNNTVEALVGS